MSWCDKLASVPAIGLTLSPHYASGDQIIDCFTPIIDEFHKGDKPTFSVDRHESFLFQASTEDGFTYYADPTRLNITFSHKMRAKHSSGGPPIMEMISVARPYTNLLEESSQRLQEAASLLPGIKTRKVSRIGVASITHLTEADMPPGIMKLLHYIGAPWSNKLPFYNFQLAATITERDNFTDRCIHTLVKGEDSEGIIQCTFDWQRTFTPSQSTSRESIERSLNIVQREALDYFERLAEGNRWDAELIGSASS